MTTATVTAVPARGTLRSSETLRAMFWLGVREIRTAIRQPAYFLPGILIPVFFYFVQVGALSSFASRAGVTNYKAFQLPVSVMFAVTSSGAGQNMVADIESGYFDKLCLTPVSRLSILVGAMGADSVRIVVQGMIVMLIALATGMHFATGLAGAVMATFIGAAFGIAISGLGFAIAIKTGNSQATQSIWALVIPIIFLSPAFAPKEALNGWLRTASTYNPMTYVFDGMRALGLRGWMAHDILAGLVAAGAVGTVTIGLAFRAMIGRTR